MSVWKPWKNDCKVELHVTDIYGDGHCQYESVSRCLDSKISRQELRALAATYIQNSPDLSKTASMDHKMPIEAVLKGVLTSLWGDENTLQALSKALQINILVLSTKGIVIPLGKYDRTILLAFSGNHYEPLGKLVDGKLTKVFTTLPKDVWRLVIPEENIPRKHTCARCQGRLN